MLYEVITSSFCGGTILFNNASENFILERAAKIAMIDMPTEIGIMQTIVDIIGVNISLKSSSGAITLVSIFCKSGTIENNPIRSGIARTGKPPNNRDAFQRRWFFVLGLNFRTNNTVV